MVDGRYIYCIAEGEEHRSFGNIGVSNSEAYTVNYKDISAVISNIPFIEILPNVDNITEHQRVINASRNVAATIPVRFGTIFKNGEGVRKLLVKSYRDFKTKLAKLKDKDEFGVKVILDMERTTKIRRDVENSSDEVKKMKDEVSTASEGSAYFLKMKMRDAIRNETLKQIDKISGKIHQELSEVAEDSCLLKPDLDQIILNSAYLVSKKKHDQFIAKFINTKKKYETKGLTIHMSGPWAPYSFC